MNIAPFHRYFGRNLGEWDWVIRFRVTSIGAVLRADESFATKWRILSTLLVQTVFGLLVLWTRVDHDSARDVVVHDTECRKLGMTFFRSRETMTMHADGAGMEIAGEQFVWPRMGKALPLGPFDGRVLESTTEATYRMEVLGVPCDFRSQLDGIEGVMRFEGEWISGSFELTEACKQRLRERRGAEGT